MSGFVDDVLGGSSGLLLGTFTPRLDDKGRLILPAKFRPRLAPGLVMTRGQERCLFLLPMDEFRRMYDQIRQAPVTSKQARDYLRVFLSGASDEIPDKQGRVSIPAPLRAYAGLDRDVAVIGAGTASRSGTPRPGRRTSRSRSRRQASKGKREASGMPTRKSCSGTGASPLVGVGAKVHPARGLSAPDPRGARTGAARPVTKLPAPTRVSRKPSAARRS